MQAMLPSHELLRQVYVFEALDDAQLHEMIKSSHHVRLDPHETLFERGELAERFYLLESGEVKLFQVSIDGYEKIFEIVQPGQTFAEALMFVDHPRYPVSGGAITGSELYSFDMRVFRNILKHSNETCFRVMNGMSTRLHGCIREINSLALRNATYRLVNYLLEQLPPKAQASPTIHLEHKKSIIAAQLSIQPETFSRILARLVKNGIITVTRQDITVHNVHGLRDFLRQ